MKRYRMKFSILVGGQPLRFNVTFIDKIMVNRAGTPRLQFPICISPGAFDWIVIRMLFNSNSRTGDIPI
jgi:hypothetical protein